MKVLITGASGFLGNAIASQAIKHNNWEVFGLISGRRQVTLPSGVKPVVANLFEPESAAQVIKEIKPDILLHLAWDLETKDFLRSLTNIKCLEMSLTLLRAFVEAGGKRFVFSGSSAEYGYNNPLCEEKETAIPEDLYGICKLSFTQVAQFFCQQNGIKYTAMRYFSIYGAGEKHLVHAIPLSINTFISGHHFVCKSPKNAWDYIYIDDAAEATIKILESNYSGIVNVGTGCAMTMREVFQTIANEMKTERLLQFEEEQNKARMSIADTKILNNIIGYSCKTDFKQGIRKTIQWMQSYCGGNEE